MTFSSKFRTLLFAVAVVAPMLMLPATRANAGVFVSIGIAPPALPVYVQPPLPAPGYIWTPGYWSYGDAGYFWVPGVWVNPPRVGVLWTPGYWGFAGGLYGWHGGYWGPHVGFYGGVNYGFGYGGVGFFGGEWRGGAFAYNSAVANFGGVHVTNVYENRTVIQQNTIINNNHVSYNGGAGIQAHASPGEMQAANENHIEPTGDQMQHEHFAGQDRSQLASVNGGHPGTMAAANPGAYHQVAQQHAQSQPSPPRRSALQRPRRTFRRRRCRRRTCRKRSEIRNLPRRPTAAIRRLPRRHVRHRSPDLVWWARKVRRRSSRSCPRRRTLRSQARLPRTPKPRRPRLLRPPRTRRLRRLRPRHLRRPPSRHRRRARRHRSGPLRLRSLPPSPRRSPRRRHRSRRRRARSRNTL